MPVPSTKTSKMLGRVHSIESFGTVDGPGVRLVVFLQGCPLRCIYCHNPDTWDLSGGKDMSVDEIISLYLKRKEFYSGGITVTGGEPLVQIDFVTELFKAAKEKGIHTCIDTSGITFNPDSTEKQDILMRFTDLVMLDIKHIDSKAHIGLTGKDNKNILEFAKYLEKKGVDFWVRHVVVEGYTENPADLIRLGEFLADFKYLKALDVLPFHNLGKSKYSSLGIDYKLKDMPNLDVQKAVQAKQYILKGIKSKRQEKG